MHGKQFLSSHSCVICRPKVCQELLLQDMPGERDIIIFVIESKALHCKPGACLALQLDRGKPGLLDASTHSNQAKVRVYTVYKVLH